MSFQLVALGWVGLGSHRAASTRRGLGSRALMRAGWHCFVRGLAAGGVDVYLPGCGGVLKGCD